MKKLITLLLSCYLTVTMLTAQTAIDFTLTDCSGISQNLFSILNQGKVVVMEYEHQCGSCILSAQNIKTVINTFYSGNPGIQIMYLDNGGNNCASIANWISSNSLLPGITFEFASNYSSPYGSGMPVIIVAADTNHKTYMKALNSSDTNTIHKAIKNALADVSEGVVSLTPVKVSYDIYPNPVTSGKLILHFNKNILYPMTADIVDLTGTVVIHSRTLDISTGEKNRELSIMELREGLYFIRVYTSEGVIVKKFTVGK